MSSTQTASTPPRRRWLLAAAAALWTIAVVAVPALVVPSGPASADPHDFSEPIFSADARGDILTVGNAQVSCDPDATDNAAFPGGTGMAEACEAARSGGQPRTAGGEPYGASNNNFTMANIDVDGDASTFNSSTSELVIPSGSVVLWAGLHWFGTQEVETSNTAPVLPPAPADWATVRFGAPGAGYVDLDASGGDGVAADSWYSDTATDLFAGYVDVTTVVSSAGAGTYRVADIQTYTGGGGGGYAAGWSLTVAFAHPDEPVRNLTVWHGWDPVHPGAAFGPLELSLAGFTPPPAGDVNTRVGVVAVEGDRDRTPTSTAGGPNPCWSDTFAIASDTNPSWQEFPSASRPWPTAIQDPASGVCSDPSQRRDFFLSTIADDIDGHPAINGNPSHPTNMATDIALVESDALSNDSTELRLRAESLCGCEQIQMQVVHAAIELYTPSVTVTKDVEVIDGSGPHGTARPGDSVRWSITTENPTDFALHDAVVVDELPAEVTLIPGTIRYIDGGPAGLLGDKTDTPGDDEADFDPAAGPSGTLTFRLGTGATATSGGVMGSAASGDGSNRVVVTFDTMIDDDVPLGTRIENLAVATGESQPLDDPFDPITSRDDDPAEVTLGQVPGLIITKTTEEQTFTPGTHNAYGLVVTNTGAGPEPAAIVTDTLRQGLSFESASGGGTYDLTSRTVTWPPVALGPGDSVGYELAVTVDTPPHPDLVDETGTVPNTARVTGTQACLPDDEDPDCASTVENPVVDLVITKATEGQTFSPGVENTYRIKVENTGTADEPAAIVSDVLRSGLTFASATDGGTYGPATRTVTWPAVPVPAGDSVTFEVVVTVDRPLHPDLVDASGQVPNTARVTGSGDCIPDVSIDSSCASTVTNPPERPRLQNPTSPRPPTPASATPTATPTTRPGPLSRTGSTLVGLVVAAAVIGAVGSGLLMMSRRRRLA